MARAGQNSGQMEGENMKESEILHQLGVLSAQLVKCRERAGEFERIAQVLRSIPGAYFWNGSLGESHDELNVVAKTPGEAEFELAHKYESGSNYAGNQHRIDVRGDESLRALHDQTVVVQLANLVQVHGKPLWVKAKFTKREDWPGRDYVDEQWEVEFRFP